MRRIFAIALAALFFIGSCFVSSPALALLREHHQSPGILRYHAQHSIKDKQQRAWQVILFPEDKKQTNIKYYLRLVGFPGLAEFRHPQSLEIITSEGQVLLAPDVFAQSTPASNVGQYDVTDILASLPSRGSIKLIFSLLEEGNTIQDVALKIPNTILTEWQWLNQKYHS